ncbi:MAG: DUF4912 domain-containing protein [Treponema sp.]|jgi:hypothetical protein|nr:DUF4912 domain-containing protein [Treponema sp.]
MVDKSRLVRPYLDSLTTRELVRIADSCGIDIPSYLERIFIIEELLDYARAEEDGDEDGGESLVESPDYLETAPIPRRYNITFIDVMIRDPLWVFVFWEVKEHDGEIIEMDPDFSGYYLRVKPERENGPVRKDFPSMIQIDPGETARYLGFSEYPARSGGFRVELCAVLGGRTDVLAVSRVFRLPGLPGKAVHDWEGANPPPLLSLSGLNDFPILRDMDRLPYRRFSCGES